MQTDIFIPKKLFYVFLGTKKTKPPLLSACIYSWHSSNPTYTITEINEEHSLFFVAQQNEYFVKCYNKKLWAFASDYLRVLVLYHLGGIYLDTDMMLIQPLDSLLTEHSFLGLENAKNVNAAIFGAEPKNAFVKKILDFYETEVMSSPLYTIPTIISFLLEREYHFTGCKEGEEKKIYTFKDTTVYPTYYFYPYYCDEEFTIDCIKQETYSIHFWNNSWSATKFWVKNKHNTFLKRMFKYILYFLLQISIAPKKGKYYLKLFGITLINIR